MEPIQLHIEALIFSTEQGITTNDIRAVLMEVFESDISKKDVEDSIEAIQLKYADELFPFELVRIAGGFQFLTKGAYHNTLSVYLNQTTKKRLSTAALETLSIIAYKQPVTKSEIESIRGVSCDYTIQKLLEKELIDIAGRADTVGKPLLYATSEKFMDYFGLSSMKDLPKPKDFKMPETEIGEAESGEEEVPTTEVAVVDEIETVTDLEQPTDTATDEVTIVSVEEDTIMMSDEPTIDSDSNDA